MGGGFPPPPPTRAPPVLLPLLRLACAGDPGAPHPGPRRQARRYACFRSSGLPRPLSSFLCPLPPSVSISLPPHSCPLPSLLLPFSVDTLLISETPPNSGTSAYRAMSFRWAFLSLSFPFCKDFLQVFPVFALCLGQAAAWHLQHAHPASLREYIDQRQTRREDASVLPAGANLSRENLARSPTAISTRAPRLRGRANTHGDPTM